MAPWALFPAGCFLAFHLLPHSFRILFLHRAIIGWRDGEHCRFLNFGISCSSSGAHGLQRHCSLPLVSGRLESASAQLLSCFHNPVICLSKMAFSKLITFYLEDSTFIELGKWRCEMNKDLLTTVAQGKKNSVCLKQWTDPCWCRGISYILATWTEQSRLP